MVANYILLDTSVLSEARRAEPDQSVVSFLLQLPDGALAVPEATIFELERGAANIGRTDPGRGERLRSWLDGLLATDVWVPPSDVQVRRLVARMSTTPELRSFWVALGDPPKMRFGCDPEIAATAITYGIPIATNDVGDFLRIHRHYPLPGLYCPIDKEWHVPPPDGWTIAQDKSIVRPNWHELIRPA